MNCLVTGGAGFIGSHVVDRLLAGGHQVWVLDDLSVGNGNQVNKKARLVEGSILNRKLLDEIMTGKDWVFHLAAWARVPRSVEDPVGTHEVNVNGTLNVYDAARLAGVKRVVYSSSSSVYGVQKTYMMKETLTPHPLSPYALHKWIGELYAEQYRRLYGLEIVALRYFNVYGPRQLTEGAYALVIGKFLESKAKGEEMTIYGDGSQTRAFTYVEDVVKANLLAAQIKGSKIKKTWIFNIGTEEETSVNQVADIIGGKQIHIIPNPRGEFEEMRKAADFSLAAKVLGWEPKVTFEQGMKKVLSV